jgi:hypothetical protein
MANLILNGSTSGSVTLSSPAVSGTTTLTLPTTSGTVITTGSTFAGTGPAFSAYQSASTQSFSNATFTKVILPSEEFDTASAFDSTTNYRFTPQVAGYYQINGSISFDALPSTELLISIYKNGSVYKHGTDIKGTNMWVVTISSLVYLNGSTDYVELYGLQVSGQSRTANAESSFRIWFNGAMIRSA